MIKKLNKLFFLEEEVAENDIVAYTVGATLLVVILYLKMF